MWPFKILLESKDIIPDVNVVFRDLLSSTNIYGDNPLHTLAEYTPCEQDAKKIIELLIDVYTNNSLIVSNNIHPLLVQNCHQDTPFSLAIIHKNEAMANYILSVDENIVITCEKNVLFLAIENECHEVAKEILKIVDKKGWTQLLSNDQKLNVLQLAPLCTDEEFGAWLVDEASELITEQDNNEQSPWDTAYEVGSSWFINVVLKKDPSVFNRAPMTWIKACEKGDVATLCAFINHNPGAFRDLCIEYKDSPLHHIQLTSLTEYEEFLRIPYMKDLINLQDSKGATPLHKALQNHKKLLAETLLNIEKIDCNIKDKDQKSATDLLAKVCNDDNTWEKMCQRIGFDPWIKTSYFQRKTNLLEVRNSLFVVAALLATITFTAGFTLPGGLKQETGEALLAKKVVFFGVFDIEYIGHVYFHSGVDLPCMVHGSSRFE
ncbi:uncharacterized protein LOC110725998 [Chenopodium quinoa]|uniref:uncharacterized protein LOC110725998 n=1 Tax=Chenopodium quinoa TaxID=63459 RepID=UPI000B7770F9|nr:uncharacterized protein LOC110725998 [Chenopodium quinoa]